MKKLLQLIFIVCFLHQTLSANHVVYNKEGLGSSSENLPDTNEINFKQNFSMFMHFKLPEGYEDGRSISLLKKENQLNVIANAKFDPSRDKNKKWFSLTAQFILAGVEKSMDLGTLAEMQDHRVGISVKWYSSQKGKLTFYVNGNMLHEAHIDSGMSRGTSDWQVNQPISGKAILSNMKSITFYDRVLRDFEHRCLGSGETSANSAAPALFCVKKLEQKQGVKGKDGAYLVENTLAINADNVVSVKLKTQEDDQGNVEEKDITLGKLIDGVGGVAGIGGASLKNIDIVNKQLKVEYLYPKGASCILRSEDWTCECEGKGEASSTCKPKTCNDENGCTRVYTISDDLTAYKKDPAKFTQISEFRMGSVSEPGGNIESSGEYLWYLLNDSDGKNKKWTNAGYVGASDGEDIECTAPKGIDAMRGFSNIECIANESVIACDSTAVADSEKQVRITFDNAGANTLTLNIPYLDVLGAQGPIGRAGTDAVGCTPGEAGVNGNQLNAARVSLNRSTGKLSLPLLAINSSLHVETTNEITVIEHGEDGADMSDFFTMEVKQVAPRTTVSWPSGATDCHGFIAPPVVCEQTNALTKNASAKSFTTNLKSTTACNNAIGSTISLVMYCKK